MKTVDNSVYEIIALIRSLRFIYLTVVMYFDTIISHAR